MTTKKLLTLGSLLWSLSVACSGEQQEEFGSECVEDGDCGQGFVCEDGYCASGEPITSDAGNGADAGGRVVEVSGVAMGAPGVEVEVETEDCRGTSCDIPAGSNVTFHAPMVAGYRFTGWSGNPLCSGVEPDLMLENVSAKLRCIANYIKRVKVSGAGETTIAAVSEGEFAACEGSMCEVDQGGTVMLTADPREGFRFAGFSGAGCEDVSGMMVTVVTGPDDVVCTASFAQSFIVSGSAQGAPLAVTATSASPGAMCDGGACTVDQGGQVTLAAPLDPAYRFAGWSGSEGCVGAAPVLAFEGVSANIACVANYTARYVVTGNATGATATLSATSLDAFASCTGASCEVDAGSSVLLSAPTVAGYRFVGFSGEGCSDVTGSSVTVGPVMGNVTCTAQYAPGIAVIGNVGIPNPSAGVKASSPDKTAVCTADTCVLSGPSDVTLVAPDLTAGGYRFTGWSGAGCVGTGATLTLLDVAQSMTCTAQYVARFVVRGTSPAAAQGVIEASSADPTRICANGACTVDRGASVRLNAVASTGYRFTTWSGGGPCAAASNPLDVTNVSANVTCNAAFVRRFTVTFADPAQGSISAAMIPSTASCTSSACQVDEGSALELRAAADPGFRFTGWSGCSSSVDPVLTLGNVASNLTCVANFSGRFTVSGTPAPAAGGSVIADSNDVEKSCSGGACTVDAGSNVTLTASPSAGYRFTAWSGCSTATTAALTLSNISANIANCTANFAQRLTVTGTTAPAGLSIVATSSSAGASCSGATCSVDSGSAVTLTAAASSADYQIEGFTGTGCSDANPDNNLATLQLGSVTASLNCVAVYRVRISVAVATSGVAGTVSITSPGAGINCTLLGNDIRACFVPVGTSVTINAVNAGNTRLGTWTGGTGCAGTASHALSVSTPTTCTASFYGLWSRAFFVGTRGSESVVDLGYGLHIKEDGNVLVSGIMTPAANAGRAWLAELSASSGAMVGQAGYTDGSNTSGYGIAASSTGYAVAAASTATRFSRPLMLGFDPKRTLLWAREIPTADGLNDYLVRVIHDTKAGYVAAGYVASTPARGHIAALNAATGAVNFNRQFCMPQPGSCGKNVCYATQAVDIVPTANGFAVASQVQRTDQQIGAFYALLSLFDQAGNTTAEFAYRRPLSGDTFHDLLPQGLLATPDGGFLMVGRTKDLVAGAQTVHDGFAMKLSAQGAIEWQTRIGTPTGDELFTRAALARDSAGYVVAGYAPGPSTNDGWLVRLQANGSMIVDNPATRINEAQTYLYDLGNSEGLYDVRAMRDGGYALTGFRFGLGDPSTNLDVWALRVDDEGGIVFNATSGATRAIGAHLPSALGVEGPIRPECVVNEDRATAGTTRIDELNRASTPITVNQAIQAP
jgi:hypothetical protein